VPKNEENTNEVRALSAKTRSQNAQYEGFIFVMESADLQVKKRLMGFEPTTFCMAIRAVSEPSGP
jgi:hypothetical protein